MNKDYKALIPVGHIHVRESILDKGNVVGVNKDRAKWARRMDLPKEAEYTFFAGCGYQLMKYIDAMMGIADKMEWMGMATDRLIGMSKTFKKAGIDVVDISAKFTAATRSDPYTKALKSAINVLRKLGVDIGYLHEDEPCCGSPLYYDGFLDDYIDLAKKNNEKFKSLGVKKIIGMVPACTSSLRNVYHQYIPDYDLEVYYLLEVLAWKLRELNIKPKLKQKLTITYHEPCQQSRYLKMIDEPRAIIDAIEGLELREPGYERSGQWSTCCGGGGLEVCGPELSERLGRRRMEELLATKAEVIVTSCPACFMQLKNTADKMRVGVKVMDLVEVLEEALSD
jgi:Fe-S oxidoreductase